MTEVLQRSYHINVCPECGGKVSLAGIATAAWHSGDCPNRYEVFVVREVEVVPLVEVERLRLHANSARVCLERFRVRPESVDLLATAIRELDDAMEPRALDEDLADRDSSSPLDTGRDSV